MNFGLLLWATVYLTEFFRKYFEQCDSTHLSLLAYYPLPFNSDVNHS